MMTAPDIWPLSQIGDAEVRMPNLYEILATVDAVPSQLMIDVLNLLEAEGSEISSLVEPTKKFLRKRNTIRGKYALASLILVKPRLVLDREPGEGEIGPAQLSWGDVEGLYYSYFLQGRRIPPFLPPAPNDTDGAAEPPSAGDDLPSATE
jgi:hypothetical protein